MLITIIILVLSAIFFVNGKIRSDIVALCALVALLVFQILTPDEALSGFSNSVVIMMIGLFVVGGAIFQTGLAKMISSRILKLAGTSEIRLFLLVMLVTSAIGAFVSNTGTVALMLPIVVSLAMSAGMNPSRLLMPLAFASSMGGMMTLIGTPPNLVIQNTLTSAGLEPLSFFSFLPVGIVCVIVGTLVLMPLSKWFLSKKGQKNDSNRSGKSLKQLVNEYGLSSNLFRLQVIGDSRLLGKTIIDLDIRRKYGLNIMEVRRGDASQHRFLKTITQKFAAPVLQVEDILYVTGDFEKVQLFAEDYLLDILGDHATEETKNTTSSLDFYDIGIAEIVLMPASNLVNQTIKEAGFRDKYNVNVLGIRRKKEYLLQDLGNEHIHSGDVLLVQGTWGNIARLSKEDSDWVVLGQPLAEAAKVTLDYKAPVAAAIMVLMVVMMVFDFIPVAPVTAVMIAGILMVLTGCFRNVEAAYKTINWESIVLIAAMLPMSLALEKTGASEYISNTLVSGLGSYGPLALMAGIYFTTSLMTMFISNTATAVLLAPIALQSAIQIGVSPIPFLFAVTVGTSMCFASPFSTPPNALVMPAGQYTFMDYVKVGLPLQIIMGIVMIFVLPLIFPF
jgi:di/tricarboxylate transporter